MTPDLPAIGSIVDVTMSMTVTNVEMKAGVTIIRGEVKYGENPDNYCYCSAPLVCCEVVDRHKEFA